MGSQNWPRISIVTPAFNQDRFIEQTIRSVLDQDYPNLEYIIIDGGSTDRTADIIRQYESRLAYWVSEKDSGAADAIAKGFRLATGSILAYLNSDDYYLPRALHHTATAFLESDTDVIYGNTYWVDTHGRIIGERRQTPFVPLGYLYGGFDLQQPATFWSRRIYDKAGGIDADFAFAFDTDLFFRFVKNGARFHHTNQFMASFRIHSESKSSTQLQQCALELDRLRRKHLSVPFRSFRAACIRNYARSRRALSYLVQGDLGWLLGRIPDRFRSRHSREIVGPRAKWI